MPASPHPLGPICAKIPDQRQELFLIGLFRRRLKYPALKRAVREQQVLYNADVVLIEDKPSGTQLIQEVIGRRLPLINGVPRCPSQTT
jgi:phage terminase large subunit-like protein